MPALPQQDRYLSVGWDDVLMLPVDRAWIRAVEAHGHRGWVGGGGGGVEDVDGAVTCVLWGAG